ncbi:acetyl-CoA decarbonylase/synthase complex subunit gamma [Candidatus Hecatella orcuttiae]|jgi:acetyl-CoA decarbonylase/synthase complex subunit gamma|uniref:acetyl-CoA decarbonylase/synthase complex subunit gamma n=1 Tax=Candidatus Hecatella orcuttiae TaxID=1935119 RepID=UPI002867F7A3|nr:acetyl-CoA decarbonylase/synthase complex subunit gamma [Candidatus Hecatella orcuttiae]
MPEKVTMLTVYKLLPQTNCGKCGEVSCMSFAAKLLDRKAAVEECKPLIEEASKYGKQHQQLVKLLAPPVREVVIGVGDRAVKVGGKEVMYRHELTYHNPTALAVDVSDKLEDSEIVERCRKVEEYQVTRMGMPLRLDMVAIRCASDNPERFAQAVALAAKNCSLPMILCSFNPEALRLAVEQKGVFDRRPLLYAATKDNWREVATLALQYKLPLAVFAPNNLPLLKSLSRTLQAMGLRELVLDPGTYTEGHLLGETFNNFTMIRRAAIEQEDEELGYPLLAAPLTVWMAGENPGDPQALAFKEAYMASLFLVRFSDILILHALEPWTLLPLVSLRQNIYTDPRKPVAIEPGLREVGKPDRLSPVFVTTNFALTAYTVLGDLESAGISGYVLVIDTEGLAVEVSVAGGQFTSARVKQVVESSGIEKKVEHRKLILPGKAARLRGDVEDDTHWEVMVGPQDSSQIKDFLSKSWQVPEARPPEGRKT